MPETPARTPTDAPDTSGAERAPDLGRLLLPGAIVGGLLVRLLVLALAGNQLTDDAYIFFRYARNAVEGSGLVYNPGESVFGFTSPLYTSVLAATGLLVGPGSLPFAAQVLGAATWVGLAWVAVLLARRTMPLPWLAVLVPVAWFSAVLGAFNGMETGLFLLLVFAAVHLLVVERTDWALVVLALCALTRPEGLLLAGLGAGWVVVRHRRALPWRGAVAAVGLAGAWVTAAVLLYGSVVPQSLIAKAGSSDTVGVASALRNLSLLSLGLSTSQYRQLGSASRIVLGIAALLVLALVVVDATRRWRHRQADVILPLWFLSVWLGYTVAQPVNVWSWYTAPTSVVALWSCARVIGDVVLAVQARHPRARLLQPVLGAGAVLVLLVGLVWTTARRTDNLRAVTEGLEAAAEAVSPSVADGGVVMVGDIGVVGWRLGDAEVFDLSGLVTERGAARDGDEELLSLGYLLRSEQPDAVVLSEDPRDRDITTTGSLRRTAFVGDELDWFEDNYRLVLSPAADDPRPRWAWIHDPDVSAPG